MPRMSSFQKFRLLNRSRGPIVRGVAAIAAWIMALTLSGQPKLAAASAHQFWQGDILQGARRIVWLARRGRLQLRFGDGDHAFDFTADMASDTLHQATQFLTRHSARNSARVTAADNLLIAARTWASDAKKSDVFQDAAQRLLDGIPPIETITLRNQPDAHIPLTHQDAVQALHDCASLFKGMSWFVLSGTYLGLIRENGFLLHDYDIDVGVMQDVPLSQIATRLQGNASFVLRKIDTQPAYGLQLTARPMLLKLIHRSGVPIDIFYHYDTGDGRLVHGSSLHHWFNTTFTLQDYVLEGVQVQGPVDADRYLTENYGDWRTPVIDFNCTTDTPNLAIVRHPSTIALFLQRLTRFAEIGDPNLPKLVAELIHEGIITKKGKGFVLGENLTG